MASFAAGKVFSSCSLSGHRPELQSLMFSSPNKSKSPQRLIKLNSKLPTSGCKSYISAISQGLGLEIGHPLVEPFSDLLPKTPELHPKIRRRSTSTRGLLRVASAISPPPTNINTSDQSTTSKQWNNTPTTTNINLHTLPMEPNSSTS